MTLPAPRLAFYGDDFTGAARSMYALEQERELDGIGRYFAQLGAAVTHYKTCSTFDSSPDIGSIGTAVGILGRANGFGQCVPTIAGALRPRL